MEITKHYFNKLQNNRFKRSYIFLPPAAIRKIKIIKYGALLVLSSVIALYVLFHIKKNTFVFTDNRVYSVY